MRANSTTPGHLVLVPLIRQVTAAHQPRDIDVARLLVLGHQTLTLLLLVTLLTLLPLPHLYGLHTTHPLILYLGLLRILGATIDQIIDLIVRSIKSLGLGTRLGRFWHQVAVLPGRIFTCDRATCKRKYLISTTTS